MRSKFAAAVAAFAPACAFAAVAPAASVAATSVAAPAPTPIEARAANDAVRRGRDLGRVLVFFGEPGMCAIATLRPACAADFEAFAGAASDFAFDGVPGMPRNALPRMRKFLTGRSPDVDAAWAHAPVPRPSRADWTSAPQQTWLQAAGVADEQISSVARDPDGLAFVAAGAAQLAEHANDGRPWSDLLPPEYRAATASVPKARDAIAGLAQIPAAIEARFPVTPVPDLPRSRGARELVFGGLAACTLAEMLDRPLVLALPESQAFVNVTIDRLSALATQPADQAALQKARATLRPGPKPFDRDALQALNRDVFSPVELHIAQNNGRAFAVGLLAGQTAYNAVTFRDRDSAHGFIGALAQLDDADAAFPGLKEKRMALASARDDDWGVQYRSATALVEVLLSR